MVEALAEIKKTKLTILVDIVNDAGALVLDPGMSLGATGVSWSLKTEDLCLLMLAVSARQRLGLLAEDENGTYDGPSTFPAFDTMMDDLCGVERGGWCRHVKSRGLTIGGYCGRKTLEGMAVCDIASHAGSDLECLLVETVLGFPEEPDRPTALVVDPTTGECGDGNLIGCLSCTREVTAGFLAAFGVRAPPDYLTYKGPFLLAVETEEVAELFFNENAPPVMCAACLAADPLYTLIGAAIRELARGCAGKALTVLTDVLVLPVPASLIPKNKRGPAFHNWRSLGLPIDSGFGLELRETAKGLGLSPAAKAAFSPSQRGALRRRAQHAAALDGAMAGVTTTPRMEDLGGDELFVDDGPDDGRARAPPSVGRELGLLGRPPAALGAAAAPAATGQIPVGPVTTAAGLALAGGGGGLAPVAAAAAGNGGHGDGGNGGYDGLAGKNGGQPPNELTAVLGALRSELGALRGAVTELQKGGGPNSLYSAPRTTCSVLSRPFEWVPEDHSADSHGFPTDFGAHAEHPERHQYLDVLGVLSVLMDGDKAKAYGKMVFAAIGVTRVDKALVGGRFPFSPFAVREASSMEVQLAGGVRLSSGPKPMQFPIQATWTKYLEALMEREWALLGRVAAPTIPHSDYRKRSVRMGLITFQFFHVVATRLTVHHVPTLGWRETWVVMTQIFYEHFYGPAWQPHGIVQQLMETVDKVGDASLRALSGGTPILDSVAKSFLFNVASMVHEAAAACAAHVGGPSALAGPGFDSGDGGGGGVAKQLLGPLCGVMGCPGYSKSKGYLCPHVFTRKCDTVLSAKAGGGVCGLPHASFGTRAWTCVEAKALSDTVTAGGQTAAFKTSFTGWVAAGGKDAAAVKALAAKLG